VSAQVRERVQVPVLEWVPGQELVRVLVRAKVLVVELGPVFCSSNRTKHKDR
jgi:hypothetical protein